ncbi:MAG: arginine--tRNA ligase [Rhodothermaeota bacterium MED-G64]|nr:MAG: arginine--tRNA ligase [Rhodothermaeota bacterium MED-G64]
MSLKPLFHQAIQNALLTLDLKESDLPNYTIEAPKDPSHGDLSTNIAMVSAKAAKEAPQSIAAKLADALRTQSDLFSDIGVAGPGFINIRFKSSVYHQEMKELAEHADVFGRNKAFDGKKIILEFVSANPTGPLTVGHGRNAVLGDTMARLYEWCGATVTREYYFNNAGRQMRMLGESVKARYAQQLGKEAELPEGGYEGEYISEIAATLVEGHGNALLGQEGEGVFKEAAEKTILEDITRTLDRMQVKMDSFFNEQSLYENKAIYDVVEKLNEKGLVYQKDGAVWFATSQLGKDKDTVLIKKSGEPTYRLPDIAYHRDKLDRGFDLCIDIFGADHIDTYPDVLRGIDVLGYDANKIDVLVYQFVTLVKDGKPYKMSTRKANFVTLDELMNEVGSDVTRFFFLMRSPSTHLEFDVAQAKEASDKNPVFYLQYAHARIQSVLRKVSEELGENRSGDVEWSTLEHEAEHSLMKKLFFFPDVIETAARAKEPHKVITYLQETAQEFTHFYHECRIMGEPKNVMASRAKLAEVTATVLKNGLSLLGVEAPESM